MGKMGKSRATSKTYITSVVAIAAGVVSAIWGIDIPEGMQGEIVGGVMAVMGVVGIILREMTKEPLKGRE